MAEGTAEFYKFINTFYTFLRTFIFKILLRKLYLVKIYKLKKN